MQIGMIGYGNMASAIAGGILKQGLVPPHEIAVYDVSPAACAAARSSGFTVLENEKEITLQSKYVFLCVKPQGFTALLSEIKNVVTEKNVFLSIAAGIRMEQIADGLGQDVPIIRAMPNTPLLLGCGAVALTSNAKADTQDVSFLRSVFESVGTVYDVPETQFNEIINVNGSTPAYIYLFAKTIIEFAQETGIASEVALPMFCDTLKGSAEMLQHSGKSADTLIDMVSSKGGTTIAALNKFAETGFADSLRAGMRACLDRAYEMSEAGK